MSLPATRHRSIGHWLDSQLHSGSKPSSLSIPRRFPCTRAGNLALPGSPGSTESAGPRVSSSSRTPWIQVDKLLSPPLLPFRRRGTSRRPSIPRAESNTHYYYLDWKILRSAVTPSLGRQTCSRVPMWLLICYFLRKASLSNEWTQNSDRARRSQLAAISTRDNDTRIWEWSRFTDGDTVERWATRGIVGGPRLEEAASRVQAEARLVRSPCGLACCRSTGRTVELAGPCC